MSDMGDTAKSQSAAPTSATNGQEPQGFTAAAEQLYERFERLWATRDASLISAIVAADGQSFWSGQGAVAGRDYPDRWRSLVQTPDVLEFSITGRAAEEPYLFVGWHARAVLGGENVEFDGVDRFRLRGELADEVYVVFDTTPMRSLLEHAAHPRIGSAD
jgi:hypothetical protein